MNKPDPIHSILVGAFSAFLRFTTVTTLWVEALKKDAKYGSGTEKTEGRIWWDKE